MTLIKFQKKEVVDLSIDQTDAEKQALLEEFERKKRARNLAIPTDDAKVRQKLLEIGEPRMLFAENVYLKTLENKALFLTAIIKWKPMDRRERLRDIVSRRPELLPIVLEKPESEISEESEDQEEEFYTYGPNELGLARKDILSFSIPRAKARIAAQQMEVDTDLVKRKKIRFEWYSHCKVI
jgi:U4/U6 small nuclear ribonucleoprotein PRP4